MTRPTLDRQLETWAAGDAGRAAVGATIASLAGASVTLSARLADGAIIDDPAASLGTSKGGDEQKALDAASHDWFLDALRAAPAAYVFSEESESGVVLDPSAPIAVAMDPLDGSSNIAGNISVGSIFSLFPAAPGGAASLPTGVSQIAAGFFIYGPATALVLTLGDGVSIFTLDRNARRYVQTGDRIQIKGRVPEYAINASNYRHWDEPVRAYIDDCVVGIHGPREENFNMRWIASLVAEAYRILIRGGIFLYPRDARQGYRQGRLRLLYEAFPIAFLMEQAGGAATDGVRRILEIEVAELHQRTPLVFGSANMVERVAGYHRDMEREGARSPLFQRRGLFRK